MARIYLKIRGGKSKGGYCARGFIVRTAETSIVSSDPVISSGSGAPSDAEPDGSIYMRTNGVIYKRASAAWVAMAGTGGATSASGTAATGSTAVTIGSGTATISSATATNTAISHSSQCAVGKPAIPETTAVACTLVADANVANGVAMTVAAQPAWPCRLAVIITDADTSISAGIITIVGVDASGRAATETVSLTGGSATRVSANAYSTITSITPSALVGNTGADKVAIGHSNKLGVPVPSGFTSFLGYFLQVDGVKEAIAAQGATSATFTPTTPPDGTKSYTLMYTYDIPVIQAAHTHTDSGHTHVDAGHTHTGPSHTHTLT